MHVTLHLGAHRTGATTLQRFLLANGRALEAAQVAVWAPPQTRRGMLSGLIRRPEEITLDLERLGRHSAGRLRMLQDRLARGGAERLIVSEQNMIGTAQENLDAERLYPWVFERLDRFVPAFHTRCDRIVLVIRSYDRYWASLLSQAVAAGRAVPGHSELDRLVTQPRRWRRLVEEIAAAFPSGQVLVWPYERLGGMPERELAAMIGWTLPRDLVARLAATRCWEARGPTTDEIREVLADRGQSDPIPSPSGDRWQPFDAEQRDALVAQYAEDLAWLRSGAGGLATFIERADATDLRPVDMTGEPTPDDGQEDTTGLG